MADSMTMGDLFAQLPKMMRIADDMNRMADYINDLRIITILMVAVGFVGGIGFMIYKMSRPKKPLHNRRFENDFDDSVDARPPRYLNGKGDFEAGEKYPPPPSQTSPIQKNGSANAATALNGTHYPAVV